LKRFIAIWILLSAGLNIWQSVHIKKLEEKRPIIVYKADNQGAEIKGRVVHKGENWRHAHNHSTELRHFRSHANKLRIIEDWRRGEIMIPKFRVWLPDIDQMLRVKALVFEEDKTRCACGYSFDFYLEYENATIMHSTDMVDRDGKIIFEGDIVKMTKDVYSEPTYYKIVRHRGGAYRLESKQHGCELWLRHTDCEVVGNVYENQELLEEAED